MEIRAFVDVYAAVQDIETGTIEHLRRTVKTLDTMHGRAVDITELSDELLNGWIAWAIAKPYSRKTVKNYRMDFLTLWRAAHSMGLVSKLPAQVRRVKVPRPIPHAWWPEEFQRLLEVAKNLPGAFSCGVPRFLVMRAVLLVGYYTGLRPGDLINLKVADCLHGGRIVLRQKKTGDIIDVGVWPDAMDAILATRPHSRELLFPISKKNLVYWFAVMRAKAGVRGSAKWMRRTGATRVEQNQPGAAMAYLGHKTPGLAYAHYVDGRQVQSNRPMPPPITPPSAA